MSQRQKPRGGDGGVVAGAPCIWGVRECLPGEVTFEQDLSEDVGTTY